MAQPLRPPGEGVGEGGGEGREHTSNESLFISTLVDSGSFTPSRYGVERSHIVAWPQLFDQLLAYQASAGTSPPRAIVASWEPAFRFYDAPEGDRPISVGWLATQVLRDAAERDLRVRGGKMALALRSGDLEGAYDAVAGVVPPRGYAAPATSIFDLPAPQDTIEVARVPTPWFTLNKVTGGGLSPDELMLIQARFGHGKSWLALACAAAAAKAGYIVGVISLEMPARQVTKRVLRLLAGRDSLLAEALEHGDLASYKKAVATIQEATAGTVQVYDPAHGQVNTLGRVDEVARSSDLVVIDHLGLMAGPDGRRAIDDWRVMASISNRVREINLSTTTPVIAVVQANRSGEHPGTMAVPKPSEIAQSDALGQDASLILGIRRLSKQIMKASTTKVREGEPATFFLRFAPGTGRIEEMDKTRALEYAAADDPFGDEG